MQGHQHLYHGCGSQSRVPEVFYGYCHDTNRMRMMDYSDFMNNMQTGYSNLYANPASAVQSMADAFSSVLAGAGSRTGSTASPAQHQRHHKHGCGCSCHEQDCTCECCIRCADVVEYALCGEVRRIPITFDNDSRRELDVT